MIDKAVGYLKGVQSGKIDSPGWIKKAVARHYADLKKGIGVSGLMSRRPQGFGDVQFISILERLNVWSAF